MNKEMNKLRSKVTKYDMICGLFMSLLIGTVLNRKIAIAFLLGISIAAVNYIVSVYAISKWLERKSYRVLITTTLRIFFVTICAVPFIYNFELIAAYLIGFTSHFIVLGYCIISKEGK
ncbi:hypothetical protein [Clostridium vincentii]|uniref:ATP synthase I chain n=1 Tax=Clostridium vincentii TaxID=52704 RepID=A0A2T0BH35_9CLOT|nr:hypothetical protein [Clostridium vincentii]PRR83153.1 hypothetical protein CLVI_11950 [Clostridium vincentii]